MQVVILLYLLLDHLLPRSQQLCVSNSQVVYMQHVLAHAQLPYQQYITGLGQACQHLATSKRNSHCRNFYDPLVLG